MLNDQLIHTENIRLDPVQFLSKFHTTVDVLRLDLIHPVISGNKWFKLKEYIQEAKSHDKKILLSFGGAFSNHIVATAAAAKMNGLKSIGIIRGEKPAVLSHTLLEAMNFGMELHFVSREDYKKRIIPATAFTINGENDLYLINEGGYGTNGMKGAKNIVTQIDSSAYTHIIAAVGTGTTLAGLTEAANSNQKIIGISVFKNNFSLQEAIEKLVSKENQQKFTLVHDYHFGGYAKYSQGLTDFMNQWYRLTAIPSDFVYTGKLFFAVNDMIEKKYFPANSKLLVIHSGGLQGNQSLPKGTLIF
jgi:1-aminocyclopropane-1-carboxylate deaminase